MPSESSHRTRSIAATTRDVGVESFGPHGFGFFAFHACLDMTRLPRVPNGGSPHRLRCASNSTCLARSWVARYTRADGPSGQRWPPAASGHGCGVVADSNFATLMSSPFRVGRCVGWKVSTNGHAVVGQTACRSWRSGIVVDPWGRRRVRRPRFESGHQHHVQLLAGGVGDQCAIAASCRRTVRIADGTGRAAWIPRLVAGSAPADSRGAGEQATISAVLSAIRRSCPASRQHLQQLLSGPRGPAAVR